MNSDNIEITQKFFDALTELFSELEHLIYAARMTNSGGIDNTDIKPLSRSDAILVVAEKRARDGWKGLISGNANAKANS